MWTKIRLLLQSDLGLHCLLKRPLKHQQMINQMTFAGNSDLRINFANFLVVIYFCYGAVSYGPNCFL